MRIRLTILAGVSLSLLLVAPRLVAQGVGAKLLAADRAASDLSSDSGLVAALGKSLDRDGVLLWPGAPVVVGAEEGKRLMVAISARDTMRLTWQPLGVELARDSTLGVTWGVAVITPRLTAGAPHIGRYTAAWRRGPGRWTISALLFTGVKPVATTPAPGIPLSRSPGRVTGPAGDFVAADLAFALFDFRRAGMSREPTQLRRSSSARSDLPPSLRPSAASSLMRVMAKNRRRRA